MPDRPISADSSSKFIRRLNEHSPPAVKTLGGHVASFDQVSGTIEMHFNPDLSLCHSGNVVQGGFVAGMLDAAMAHVVFCVKGKVLSLASLEIKVSYLEVTRPGQLVAMGRVVRMGNTTCFLEADLRDANGKLLAKATSTARIFDRASKT